MPLDQWSLQDMQRGWLAALRAHYGGTAVNLTLRIVGRRATLLDLLKVKHHQAVLLARLYEAPNLAPVLAGDPGMWAGLHNWKLVKDRLLALGLQSSSWRFLCRQGKAYVARINWCELGQLAWVNMHAALKRPIPVGLVDPQTGALSGFHGLQTWVRRHHEQLHHFDRARFVLRGLRLALAHWVQVADPELRREIQVEEFPMIADWLLAESAQVGRNWTYDTLMTRQSVWHLMEHAWRHAGQDLYWPEVLGRGQLPDGSEFNELSSLNALLTEARRMHHCVPSYIDRCLAGDVCLFHVQRRGPVFERATLELRRAGAGRWAISQLKGPCNAPVSAGMWALAERVNGLLGMPRH